MDKIEITTEMSLNDKPYFQIRNGEKTVELRLYDEKRRKLREGEWIRFTRKTDSRDMLFARIKALHRFPSFEALFAYGLKEKSGFKAYTQRQAVEKMREYYSEEEELRCGVLGIEIEVQTEENQA